MDFIIKIFAFLISLVVTFPYCYAATNASCSIQSLNESVFNAIWYKLPVKYQHYIKMMLMPPQNTRQLSGYDLIDCSLETFRKVNSAPLFSQSQSKKNIDRVRMNHTHNLCTVKCKTRKKLFTRKSETKYFKC